MSDLEKLPNLYVGLLRKKENEVIREAEEFLDRPIPLPDQITVAHHYAAKNLQIQKRIANMKGQLRVLADRKWRAKCALVATENDELKEEGFRSYQERSEMVYRRSNIQNAQDIYIRIHELANYLDTIEWMLKDANRKVDKRETS